MPKPLMNYEGRCGSCKHFSFVVLNGVLRYRGCCDCAHMNLFNNRDGKGNVYVARHSNYRQASQRKCRRYENGMWED
mgnify:FL=1